MERIHGELLKIGVDVSETTVRNVLRRANIRPWDGQSSENWRSSFKRHKNIWAIDFFTVHPAPFKRMFVLVIMDIHSRRLISTRVTTHPTAEWTARVLNFEITAVEAPPGIVHDRDPAFESAQFRDRLSLNQVKSLRCPSRTPIANAFVERRSSSERSRNIKPTTIGPDLIRASTKRSPLSQKPGPVVCKTQKKRKSSQSPSFKDCITITAGRLLDIKFPSRPRIQIQLVSVDGTFLPMSASTEKQACR